MNYASIPLVIAIIIFGSANVCSGQYPSNDGDSECDICGSYAEYGLYTTKNAGIFSTPEKDKLIGEFCGKHKWIGELEKDLGLMGIIVAFGIKSTYQIFHW